MPKAVFVFLVCGKAKEKRREDLERITSGYGTQLRMNRSIQTEGSDKCAFSAVQVLYQIYKLNLSFYSKKTSTSKVGDELPGIPDQSLNPVSIIVPISVHLRKILYTQSSSKYNLNSNSLAIQLPGTLHKDKESKKIEYMRFSLKRGIGFDIMFY